ncbi:MAG: flavodoxin family protein [Paracoccus sp. (in: a-proteobacteria)]|uniref:flavodoxin family protein n=1 Tax=Paracoccus sp. TaxID=267 RepID=UPI0026E10EC2|nr:flavodoxin family protein [Paracoccus sp. (in: a-proteobacteria)]MDO5614074.1 flavodoxin family protein [Paracoccus sp. (in: a-proteobacteria)]
MQISIVYDSGFGHTKKLAEQVAQGVTRAGGLPRLMALADGPANWDDLAASDAIIFGSPTYNASVSARFKQFMEDSTRPAFVSRAWAGKLAAGFTNSGAMHGDKLNTLMTMTLFAMQNGMIWQGLDVPGGRGGDEMNRIAVWLGAAAQSNDAAPDVTPPQCDLDTAAALGEQVARTALRLKA